MSGDAKVNPISAGNRFPSGKPRNVKPLPKAGGGAIWHRISDNWEDLKRTGVNPMWGTTIGKYYLLGIFSARQASAARLYGDIVGRYDRYHPTKDADIRRTAKSPAYARASRGADDEIARRERDLTINDYNKAARRARKAYLKLDKCIPNEIARNALDDVCLHLRELPSSLHADLCKILDNIGTKFGFRWEQDPQPKG